MLLLGWGALFGAEKSAEALSAKLAVTPMTGSARELEISLSLSVSAPWHIFADNPGSGGQQPLKLELKLPAGVKAEGTWVWPVYDSIFEGQEVHVYEAGEHVFKHRLKRVDGVSKTGVVRVTVTYQACNPEFCAPVETMELAASFVIVD